MFVYASPQHLDTPLSPAKTDGGTEVSGAPTHFVKIGRLLEEKKTLFETSNYLLPKGKATATVRPKENFHWSVMMCSLQPRKKSSTAFAPPGCPQGVSEIPNPLGVYANLSVLNWL